MDVVEKYDGNSNFTHRRKAFQATTTRGDWGRGLHAQWTSLNGAIFAAHVFGDLCHVLVVGQAFGVLELVKVVHNPGVGFLAPDLRHHLLVMGRLDSLVQGLRASGEDTRTGVDVNGGVGETVEQELLVDDVLSWKCTSCDDKTQFAKIANWPMIIKNTLLSHV